MEAIEKVCKEKILRSSKTLLEAHGGFYADGKPVGSRGNLTTFSFYPTKNLSAFGDAGCILAGTEEEADKICVIRNHGRGDDNAWGRNSRCDHMQAAILHLKLETIEAQNARRKELASMYNEILKDTPLGIISQELIKHSSFHLYPIRTESKEQRKELENFIRDKRIGCADFYMRALSEEPWLAKYEGEKEEAEKMAGTTLCLPIHPFLTDEEVNTVATGVKQFFS